jgi:predicted dienelactone hydrolase
MHGASMAIRLPYGPNACLLRPRRPANGYGTPEGGLPVRGTARVHSMLLIPLLVAAQTGCDVDDGGGDQDDPLPPLESLVVADPDATGPLPVGTKSFVDLADASRGRSVPTTVYFPQPADSGWDGVRWPVVVLSHGLGGTRASYVYLAEHLAGHGYVVLVPAHVGSNYTAVTGLAADLGITVGEALTIIRLDEAEWEARPADVAFLLDQSVEWDLTDPQLHDRLDLAHLGVTGHSYGGYTSLACGGARPKLSSCELADFADARIGAAVPLSSQGIGGTGGFVQESFETVAIPMLIMVGSLDYGAEGQPPLWRREAFEYMPPGDKHFLLLENATHMDFGNGTDPSQVQTQRFVRCMALVFFNVHLKRDADSAAAYLCHSYASTLAGDLIIGLSWERK